MEKIKILFKIILSLPKTIYFNFRVFDLKTAIKLPILIANNVKILEIHKNSILIARNKIKPFMIIIGLSGSNAINSTKGKVKLSKSSKIVFEGIARFAEGIVLYSNGGTAVFGDNFVSNKNCFIAFDLKITFGADVLLGWNVNIRDSDGHTIVSDGMRNKNVKEVKIGNHVWICANVDILKGSDIGNNNVIGYRSLVSGLKTSDNNLVVGFPAVVKKNEITWEK